MIFTTRMLLDKLSDYGNPQSKIGRMVDKGELFPIIRGLYETDRTVSPHLLAASIYGPSYISFETALGYYGMIPERVAACTSASFSKHRTKMYDTAFGLFIFRDVPSQAFPFGIRLVQEGEYWFRIATKEKALCDKLCQIQPMRNQKEIESCLFDDLRIDEEDVAGLDAGFISDISESYHSANVRLLSLYLRRKRWIHQ